MSWLAVLDSRIHDSHPALSPPEVADGLQHDLMCHSDRRINKDIYFIQENYLLKKLLQERQGAALCRKGYLPFVGRVH